MHTIKAERITTVFFLFFFFLTWDWRDRKNKRATWGVLEDGWCYAILDPLFVTVPGTSALPSVSVRPRECHLSAEGEKRRWEKPTRVQTNWMGKGLATVDERIVLWKKKWWRLHSMDICHIYYFYFNQLKQASAKMNTSHTFPKWFSKLHRWCKTNRFFLNVTIYLAPFCRIAPNYIFIKPNARQCTKS